MAQDKLLSVDQISSHNQPEDCWIVVDGKVWDFTDFAPEHPGAPESEHGRNRNFFFHSLTTTTQSSGNMPAAMHRQHTPKSTHPP
jgi:L-lactate dehydrogenase (cytochrome)